MKTLDIANKIWCSTSQYNFILTFTAGKDKIYVSRIIAQILNVQELADRDL